MSAAPTMLELQESSVSPMDIMIAPISTMGQAWQQDHHCSRRYVIEAEATAVPGGYLTLIRALLFHLMEGFTSFWVCDCRHVGCTSWTSQGTTGRLCLLERTATTWIFKHCRFLGTPCDRHFGFTIITLSNYGVI